MKSGERKVTVGSGTSLHALNTYVGSAGCPRLHLSWIFRIVRQKFYATALTGAVHNWA